jgi:hypothetical protein
MSKPSLQGSKRTSKQKKGLALNAESKARASSLGPNLIKSSTRSIGGIFNMNGGSFTRLTLAFT